MAAPQAQLVTRICAGCSKPFEVLPSRAYRTCCSVACTARKKAKQAERVTRSCLACGTSFTLLASQTKKAGTGLYCSRPCIPGYHAEQVPRTCEHCGKAFGVKLSRLLVGKIKGRYCSLRCQRDSQKTPYGPSKSRPGVAAWRSRVLRRDNHTCQHCGATDRPLNAHHIKGWAECPELRTVASNGLTLCDACHFALHHPNLPNPYAA